MLRRRCADALRTFGDPATPSAQSPAIEAEHKVIVEEEGAPIREGHGAEQHWIDDPDTLAKFEKWMAAASLDMATVCDLLEIEDIREYAFSREQLREDVDSALASAIAAGS